MFLSPVADIVRRHDPDRYFATLFAPEMHRPALFTLYAFNHELARAPEVAREPGLALIRLHWWREVVEGQAKAHEVATPLHEALMGGQLHAQNLLAMIEAREAEVSPSMESAAAWREWLLMGAGSLAVAAGRVLGASEDDLLRLRRLGAGYGAAGVLRSVVFAARQGRCLLPAEFLAAFGVTPDEALAEPLGPKLKGVHRMMGFVGGALLGAPQRCGWPWVSAALPAVLARRDLARPPRYGPRLLGDRLAVTWAAARRTA